MIENMTLRVPSLADAVAAYRALGYEDAGENSAAAIALSDPALEGRPHQSIVMSEDPFQTLTMVEWEGEVPIPFSAPGWSAMEVLVKDLDALFEQLPAAFAVLNPPAALSFSDQIRAMQVAGPAGELIYFTEVSGEVPGFALPTPTRQVNQCFVMINAVTDINAQSLSMQVFCSATPHHPCLRGSRSCRAPRVWMRSTVPTSHRLRWAPGNCLNWTNG